MTMGRGWRAEAPAMRQFRAGASARSVETPIKMAECRERR